MSTMTPHRAPWGGTQVTESARAAPKGGIQREPGSFLLAIGVSGV